MSLTLPFPDQASTRLNGDRVARVAQHLADTGNAPGRLILHLVMPCNRASQNA